MEFELLIDAARCVDDLALTYNALRGADPFDSTTLDGPGRDVVLPEEPDVTQLTVGVPEEYACEGMSEEVLQAWSDALDLLENNGVRLKRVTMPHTAYSISCYSVLNPCEVASNMAR